MPAIDTFSADQVALGRAIEEIKAAWACQKHCSVCFITKEATHIELNRFRLGAFGAAIVCFRCVHVLMPAPIGCWEVSCYWVPSGWASSVLDQSTWCCGSGQGVSWSFWAWACLIRWSNWLLWPNYPSSISCCSNGYNDGTKHYLKHAAALPPSSSSLFSLKSPTLEPSSSFFPTTCSSGWTHQFYPGFWLCERPLRWLCCWGYWTARCCSLYPRCYLWDFSPFRALARINRASWGSSVCFMQVFMCMVWEDWCKEGQEKALLAPYPLTY